jgi:hypothetical protein
VSVLLDSTWNPSSPSLFQVNSRYVPGVFQPFSKSIQGGTWVEFEWTHVDSRYVPGWLSRWNPVLCATPSILIRLRLDFGLKWWSIVLLETWLEYVGSQYSYRKGIISKMWYFLLDSNEFLCCELVVTTLNHLCDIYECHVTSLCDPDWYLKVQTNLLCTKIRINQYKSGKISINQHKSA